ncbi:unnamed protein product, partial [Vitis vinifera]
MDPQAFIRLSIGSLGFYLEESDLKALLAPGCFYAPHACLEIVVFTGRKGSHCGVGIKRQQIGTFKLEFEDVATSSPQIVQLQGTIKQPIFSCKFSRDRVSQVDPLSTYWSGSADSSEQETERRERKGWKVVIGLPGPTQELG